MQNEPASASPSGCSETTPLTDTDCKHHWILGTTTHEIVPEKGLSNIGMTEGTCTLCGATRDWQSPTPDNVHGMDSHILAEMGGPPDEDSDD